MASEGVYDLLAAACRGQGLPGPVFESGDDRFSVTFEQDPFSAPRLRDLGLSERQITAIAAMHGRETITNRGYRELTGVTERTALRDLGDLAARGVPVRLTGAGRAATYRLASDVAVRPDKPDGDGGRPHAGRPRIKGKDRETES